MFRSLPTCSGLTPLGSSCSKSRFNPLWRIVRITQKCNPPRGGCQVTVIHPNSSRLALRRNGAVSLLLGAFQLGDAALLPCFGGWRGPQHDRRAFLHERSLAGALEECESLAGALPCQRSTEL